MSETIPIASLRREEARSNAPIKKLHESCGSEDRQSEGLQQGSDKHRPDRHWQAEHGHAWSPHQNDGGHVVDATKHGRNTHEGQADQPERLTHAAPWRSGRVGRQGWVTGPATRGGASFDEETGAEGDKGWPHEPVTQHIQRRKRHVIRADHQRNEKIAEGTSEDWNDHQEDHDRRVHREQHRVELRTHLPAFLSEQLAEHGYVRPGPRNLPADSQRQQAANQKPDQRGEKELQSDHLMVF